MSNLEHFPVSALSDKRLNDSCLRVLLAVCYSAGASGQLVYSDISALTGLKSTAIQNAIATLKKLGWVTTAGYGRGRQIIVNTTPRAAYSENQMNRLGRHIQDSNEPPRAAHSDNVYININNINNTDSDQIRSDACAREDEQVIKFGDVVEQMTRFGMPASYIRDDTDRGLITRWISQGITIDQIVEACTRACKSKTDGPFGPRYLDRVLTTMREEVSKDAGSRINRPGGYATGTW